MSREAPPSGPAYGPAAPQARGRRHRGAGRHRDQAAPRRTAGWAALRRPGGRASAALVALTCTGIGGVALHDGAGALDGSAEAAAGANEQLTGYDHGVELSVKNPTDIVGASFETGTAGTQAPQASLWTGDGALMAQSTSAARTSGTRQLTLAFTGRITLKPGTTYLLTVWTPEQDGATPAPVTADEVDLSGITLVATFVDHRDGHRGRHHRPGRPGGSSTETTTGTSDPGSTTGTSTSDTSGSSTTDPESSTSGSTTSAGDETSGTSTSESTSAPTTASTTRTQSSSSTTSTTSAPKTTTTTTTPSSAPAPSSGFPGASNTGVPAGTVLSPYSGSCEITTAGTVIDGKLLNCDVVIKASGVVIRKSKIVGLLDSDSTSGSVTVEDSEIDGGRSQAPALGYRNVTAVRANIHGAQHSVICHTNCSIKDSWLHGQYIPAGADWHLNAYLSNGGHDVTLSHNTIACDATTTSVGGGCTADASIFGDFASNANYTFDRNLFVGGNGPSYCFYGGYDPAKPYGTQVSGIKVTGNVFQRGPKNTCAWFGPVTSFNASVPGAVWQGNVWEDGGAVTAAM